MIELSHTPLMMLTLNVGFGEMAIVGKTPAGLRRIVPVTGGTFEGPRLRGAVVGGHDWVINRPDGVMLIDVRLMLETDDGATLYLTYQGRFTAEPDAMRRFSQGGLLEPHEYSLVISAKFECGHDAYTWLNDVVAVGTGEQTATGPIYSIFEIR